MHQLFDIRTFLGVFSAFLIRTSIVIREHNKKRVTGLKFVF